MRGIILIRRQNCNRKKLDTDCLECCHDLKFYTHTHTQYRQYRYYLYIYSVGGHTWITHNHRVRLLMSQGVMFMCVCKCICMAIWCVWFVMAAAPLEAPPLAD